MREPIRKQWHGFVPAHKSHDNKLCAYYHCTKPRADGRRWCEEHVLAYEAEVNKQNDTPDLSNLVLVEPAVWGAKD